MHGQQNIKIYVLNVFAAFLNPFRKMLGLTPHLYVTDYVQTSDTS